MSTQKTVAISGKRLAKMQLFHFGKILFNLQFGALAVMVVSVISIIIPAFYYVMLIAISLLTLFSIYAIYPEFASLWSGGETLMRVAETLSKSWKFTIPILLALSVGSILCLCPDKNKKHTVRIIISAITAALAVILLIVKLLSKGGNA